jgi:hypothetical protein
VLAGGLDDNGVTLALGRVLRFALPSKIDELLWFFVKVGAKEFADSWMCGLPMDNQMDIQLWPTDFTELFVPLEKTADVMRIMRNYYDAGGDKEEAYKRTRAYACELYAAKASPFWLSPAHSVDCFRFDPFWFRRWAGSPSEFFAPIFDELRGLDFRPHWGKFLPEPSEAWRTHYRRVFPRLKEFLELRKQLDPKQIFVTDYWREHLGITR